MVVNHFLNQWRQRDYLPDTYKTPQIRALRHARFDIYIYILSPHMSRQKVVMKIDHIGAVMWVYLISEGLPCPNKSIALGAFDVMRSNV